MWTSEIGEQGQETEISKSEILDESLKTKDENLNPYFVSEFIFDFIV